VQRPALAANAGCTGGTGEPVKIDDDTSSPATKEEAFFLKMSNALGFSIYEEGGREGGRERVGDLIRQSEFDMFLEFDMLLCP